MRALIVAGQYASGKTTLIKNIIPQILEEEKSVGAFVTESANVAPDKSRFPLPDSNSAGASFASVCCPTLADFEQAMPKAIRDKKYNRLIIELAGNMHALLGVQVAQKMGISIDNLVMLVSERDYEIDRVRPTFHSGLQVANTIGITHKTGVVSDSDKIMRHIKAVNPLAQVVSVPKESFDYSVIKNAKEWNAEFLYQGQTPGSLLSGLGKQLHNDHYKAETYVINPDLSFGEIAFALSNLAKSGLVERAKGPLPQFGKQFDVKREFLEISPSSNPFSKDLLPYVVIISKQKIPQELTEPFSVKPEQKLRELVKDASLEDKVAAFGKVFEAAKREEIDPASLFANEEVTYTFTATDQAYKIACQIYKDASDQTSLRFILPLYCSMRFKGLEALKGRNDSKRNLIGIRLANGLLHKLDIENGIDYPSCIEPPMLRKIKEVAIPSFYRYAKSLSADEIKEYPVYNTHVAPMTARLENRAWENSSKGQQKALEKERRLAIENMARVHYEAGKDDIAKLWESKTNNA